VPWENQIESLCGSLLVFDRSSKENEKDPKIKLCHKTVEDFLLLDPKDPIIAKTIPDSDQDKVALVHKFFVNPAKASIEVGLNCLTFLQYRRYESVSNVKAILDENNKDDAFLKYAAAFWFRHFMGTSHSQETFEEVRKFLESPNFWTCVALQSYLVPHVFGRYAQIRPGCYIMGLRGPKWNEEDCFGLPLPGWLEKYPPRGPELDLDFCSFVSDWHEVLASRPGALDRCVPLSTLKSQLGSRLDKSGRIRVFNLSEKLDLSDVSNLCSNSLFFCKNKLFAELVCGYRNELPSRFRYYRIPIFSKKTAVESTFDAALQATDLDRNGIRFCLRDFDSQVEIWNVDESTLRLERIVDGFCEKFAPPISWRKRTLENPWRVIGEDSEATSRGNVAVFHVSRVTTRQVKTNSGDGSNSSDSDSDSDSDSEDSDSDSTSDSGYEEDDEAPKMNKAATDWMILVHESSQPLWIPLVEDGEHSRGMACAFHPHLPVVVLSHRSGQVIIADTDAGSWRIEQYPGDLECENANVPCQR
jgi:hypothetical protein